MNAVEKTNYFYRENGVCVAIGGGEVLVWDCSIPGVVALVEQLVGHLPVDRTHEDYLRESAQKVIREVAQRYGKVHMNDQEFWVARVPGKDRIEWVYTPDKELAIVLTPHWQAKFRAYGEANNLEWRLETI